MRRNCPPAWDASAPHTGPREASCHHLAWEPTSAEREQCYHVPVNATAPCVTALWQRCSEGHRCVWKDKCNQQPTTRAWVTLLSGNALNYSANVLAQAFSAKIFSCHRHITLVTPEVSAPIRGWIARSGVTTVREVSRIQWKHAPGGVTDSYANTFSKLHAWNLTSFSQVVLLDSDTFLLHSYADQIYDHCTDPKADLCAGREDNRGLNSGVLVIRPSQRRFAQLLDAVETFRHPNARYMDQNFFNRHYNAYGWKADALDSAGLEFFNLPSKLGQSLAAMKGGHPAGHLFQSCPKYSRGAFFWELRHGFKGAATRRWMEAFAIWHHCGVHKLDVLPNCPASTDSHSFCTSRVLRLYQWLKLLVDPCSAHGASWSACNTSGIRTCKWCGVSTRCVSREHDCYADDMFSKALASRMLQPRGMSRIRPGWCSTTCDPICCAKGRRPMRNHSKTPRPTHNHSKTTRAARNHSKIARRTTTQALN